MQKFRLYLKRLSGVSQPHGGLPSSYCGPLEPNPKVGTLGRFDIQALAASGQIPPQTLAALHAELLNRPTGNVLLPAMDQSALLQASLPVSKCTTLDQNVAYGQPVMKCPSNIPKHYAQTFVSADNVHSGLGSWSPKNPVNVVAGDNLTGLGGAQNGSIMMSIMHHQPQQLRQQHEQQQKQCTLPEPSRTINVQPSCLVVPSHSPVNFQAASANQNCSFSGSSVIDYSMLLPQSNNPPLGTGRVQDIELKHASMLGVLTGAGSLSPTTLSSGSLNANNGIGMQVPTSRFGAVRQLSAQVPNVSMLQDSYSATSGHLLDEGMLKNTAFMSRGMSNDGLFSVDETGLAFTNGSQEKMYRDNTGNKVKQEPSMNFLENVRGGVPMLQRLSPNDLMSVFSE